MTSAEMFNGILRDFVAGQVAAAPKAETYRGWTVSFDYGYFNATGPDYDASYEGPEDGWVDNGQKATGRTNDELTEEIDQWFEDNGQFGLGA